MFCHIKNIKTYFLNGVCVYMFLHKGVISHAGPSNITEGPARQSSSCGEVAERESQNNSQTPDADDDAQGCLRWQPRLQRVDDGHVPTEVATQRGKVK